MSIARTWWNFSGFVPLVNFPWVARAMLVACALHAMPWDANAQCGPSVTGRFGGEVTAVAQLNATTLVVARSSEVELYNLTNPAAPAVFSPRRKTSLPAPAAKIAMTQGSSRAFVLLQNGDVAECAVNYSPLLTITFAQTIGHNAVDILADGTRVYIAATFEQLSLTPANSEISSHIEVYDIASGTPVQIASMQPLVGTYGFDRFARVGNVLWVGFHELESSIFGVDGFDITNPAAPVRVGTSLNNAPLGVDTHVHAMTSIGSNLFISYDHGHDTVTGEVEDYLRAVNVSAPLNPVWYPAFELNTPSTCMSTIGSQLRINFTGSAVGTWETSNPAALQFLGAYFDSFPQVRQMVSVSGTDYWAAGRAGLMTVNTTNPASLTLRSTPITPLPTAPKVVRQRGNITAVLDYTLNALRLYDYTLPEAQQLRSTISLPFYSEVVELGDLSGGAIALAYVASQGNPSGDSITIYDITNPLAPVFRSTIPNINAHKISVSSSRLYVFTTSRDFKIYEMSVPTNPTLRSSTFFNANLVLGIQDVTSLTSWSNNAAAIGTWTAGLWLIDTTNATAPNFVSIWNPVTNYHVQCMAKGANYLYVNAIITEGSWSGRITDGRLESLNVTNIAAPALRFVSDSAAGGGYEGEFESLTYVVSPTAKFLVGVRDGALHDDENFDNSIFHNTNGNFLDKVTLYELPPFLFFPESVPFHITSLTLPYAHGNVAPSADGSKILVAADQVGLYQIGMPTSWAPGVGIRPFDVHACSGGGANFTFFASGNPTDVTYQWFRNGIALTDGPTPWGSLVNGATTAALSITNVRHKDGASQFGSTAVYYCVATNSCGSTTEGGGWLYVCGADLDNGLGTGTCDGAITIDDLLYFLTAFEAGSPTADLDDGSGRGAQDNAVTIDDLLFFLAHFESGC